MPTTIGKDGKSVEVITDGSVDRLAVEAKIVGGIGGATGQLHIEKWPGTPISPIGVSFLQVYSQTTVGVFHDMVWHVNSNDIEVKITIDALVVLQCTLKELSNDFKFSCSGSYSGGPCWDWIHEYAEKRWRFRALDPCLFTNLKVEMKKTAGGDKKVERGMTVWREAT